jgi:hypothetical protein
MCISRSGSHAYSWGTTESWIVQAGERVDGKGRLGHDVEPGAAQPEDVNDQGTGRGQVAQDLPGRLDQRLARRGEFDAVRQAVKQFPAEFPLQGADRMGQRGLGDMKRNGRGCESAVLEHGDEVFQLTSFHRLSAKSSTRHHRPIGPPRGDDSSRRTAHTCSARWKGKPSGGRRPQPE